MTNPIPLRPHHGMCFQYFVGEGYSDNFTKNMWETKQVLDKNPEILLRVQPDGLCLACPNLDNSTCKDEDIVADYDRKVLDLTGLKEGDVLSWNKFTELVQEKILKPQKRETICGDCQWTGLCK